MALYLLPMALRAFTLASSVEMKKDRKIIDEVVLDEKRTKSMMMARIYRQLKTLYRDGYQQENPRNALNEFQV